MNSVVHHGVILEVLGEATGGIVLGHGHELGAEVSAEVPETLLGNHGQTLTHKVDIVSVVERILPHLSVIYGSLFQDLNSFCEERFIFEQVEHAAESEVFLAVVEVLILQESEDVLARPCCQEVVEGLDFEYTFVRLYLERVLSSFGHHNLVLRYHRREVTETPWRWEVEGEGCFVCGVRL